MRVGGWRRWPLRLSNENKRVAAMARLRLPRKKAPARSLRAGACRDGPVFYFEMTPVFKLLGGLVVYAPYQRLNWSQ